jgi:hypothetical protein
MYLNCVEIIVNSVKLPFQCRIKLVLIDKFTEASSSWSIKIQTEIIVELNSYGVLLFKPVLLKLCR